MYTFDQTLAGSYHVATLRAEARRDAMARTAAPKRARLLSRRAR